MTGYSKSETSLNLGATWSGPEPPRKAGLMQVVSLGESWASRSLHAALDRARGHFVKTARFQQKQKEQRLHEMGTENAAPPAILGRGSAGSGSSGGSGASLGSTIAAGKVRQMFDERRHKGIDKSYPLQPLKARPIPANPPNVKVTNQKTITMSRTNGHAISNNNQISGTTRTATIDNGNTRVVKQTVRARQTYEARKVAEEDTTIHNHQREISYEIEQNHNSTSHGFEMEKLLSNHNITDILENEVFPDPTTPILDDHEDLVPSLEDETFPTKLPNVGGDLPSKTKPTVAMNKVKMTSKPASTAVQTRTTLSNQQQSENPRGINKKYDTYNVKKPNPASSPLKKKPVVIDKAEPLSPVKQSTTNAKKEPEMAKTAPLKKTTVGKAVPGGAPLRPVGSAKSTGSNRSRGGSAGPSRPAAQKGPPPKRVPIMQRAAENMVLVTCAICGRHFANDRIQKHEAICKRTTTKKRKPYDALAHRITGTEQAAYVRTIKMNSKKRPSLQSNWRAKHNDFISTIRAAKQMQAHVNKGGRLADLPPPPRSENPDYVQCPHCGRRFNQVAAARHIPLCASMIHNKSSGTKPLTRMQQARANSGGRVTSAKKRH